MGGGWSRPRPGRFTPRKETRYPVYTRLGGSEGRSGRVRKVSSPPGFDPRTVQPVASHYTDWAIHPHDTDRRKPKYKEGKLVSMPLCLPKLPHALWPGHWTLASAVRDAGVTVSDIARPRQNGRFWIPLALLNTGSRTTVRHRTCSQCRRWMHEELGKSRQNCKYQLRDRYKQDLKLLLGVNLHRSCGNISEDSRKMVLNSLPLFSFTLIN